MSPPMMSADSVVEGEADGLSVSSRVSQLNMSCRSTTTQAAVESWNADNADSETSINEKAHATGHD